MDLEAAAAMLGVHYQTAYRLVRNGVLPAVRVGFGYDIDPVDVANVREERSRRRTPGPGPATDWWHQHEEFARSLLRGDEAVARRQLGRLQSQGASSVDLCEKLIAPAMRRLEIQQTRGQVLPAEVAAAAESCERLLGSLAAPLPGRPRGLAVVASPDGDGHRLPSLMATAALRHSRWRVQHLGSGVPAGDLAEFVEETEPALVVLSLAVRSSTTEEFCRLVAASTTVPVVAGSSGEQLSDLLTRVDRALGAGRSRRPGGVGRSVAAETPRSPEVAHLGW